MIALLLRTYTPLLTKGSFLVYDGEKQLCAVKTLELSNNGNQRNVSCIPEGEYDVIKEFDPRRGHIFRVLDVPMRDGILIHKGNFTHDTKGCILPGTYFVDIDGDGVLDVADTVTAMNKLNDALPNKFKLTILS